MRAPMQSNRRFRFESLLGRKPRRRNPQRRLTLPARLAVALLAACPTLAADVDLKINRVAVFNSGVAYYEATAGVDGSATAELTFRTEQINDILKSMIVQDFGGGRIGVVSYASQDPIEKTLRSFAIDLTGNPSFGALLGQMRGEPVEVTTDKLVRGVIVGVENQVRTIDGVAENVELLTILTDQGIQRFDLGLVGGVKLTNERIAGELRAALETLAGGHDRSKKSVRLTFDGQGRRDVRVAYLLEAPIWKTSYRLVLDDEKAPFLQGWATVENATEEDWNNVQLSLVSGRPISFVMDLYTPLYVPRPREELELYASLRPPTYEGTQSVFGRQLVEAMAPERMRALGRSAPAPATKAPGADMAMERDAWREELSLDGTGVSSSAGGAEAGELFEYTIRTPVSIARQRSAMLPIVNEAVRGTKVSIYNPSTHERHPLNGLELENATDLHLMQGPVTLFDGSVYAGDAKLPDLKPGEKRLLAYALDLGTEVSVNRRSHPTLVTATRIVRGALIQTRKFIDEREYVITNKTDRARTVLLEQPYGDDWKLVKPEKPYERTATLSRFKVEAPPRETVRQAVTLENVTDQAIRLVTLSSEQIGVYIRGQSISPQLKGALETLLKMQTSLEKTRREAALAEQGLSEARSEQGRVRENIRTLRENTDAYRRQMEKFDEFETQIERYGSQARDLRAQEQRLLTEIEQFLSQLTID